MGRYAPHEKEPAQRLEHILVVEATSDTDEQCFPAIFVQNRQNPERGAVVGSVMDKVVAPDMVAKAGAQPDGRAIVEPETSSFGLFGRHLEAFTVPDALNSLVVH